MALRGRERGKVILYECFCDKCVIHVRHAFIINFEKERIYVRDGTRVKMLLVRLTFILCRIPAASGVHLHVFLLEYVSARKMKLYDVPPNPCTHVERYNAANISYV